VFDLTPLKGNAQNIFLRRKKINHSQDAVSGCPVNFNDEFSDALHQLAILDLSPVAVLGLILIFTDQIESLEQGIDPIFVPVSLIQWVSPHSFDFSPSSARGTTKPPSMIREA
jgi:hypothetical protein